MKIVEKIKLKIVIFTAVKNRCILHGRVIIISVWSENEVPKRKRNAPKKTDE